MHAAAGTDQDVRWAAVLAHQDRVRRVARARCRSPQDAEDCAQEAMARVAAMRDVDLDRIGPLLSTVVANLAVDVHRATARAARAEPRLALLPEPSPEERLCDDAEARWLWASRDQLAGRDRAVLELRAQGRTVGEAAETLGVSYKAAESAYTRARVRMRAIWRATAAALGVLWGRPARDSAAGAAVAVAMTVVLLGAAPEDARGGGRETDAPQPVRPAAAARGQVIPTSPAVAVRAEPAAAPPPAGPAAVPPRRPTDGPGGRPDVAVPPLRVGPVGSDGTTAGREHEDETFTQTLQRCVSHGLHVSPYRIGCRDDSQNPDGGHGTGTQYLPPG